MPRLPLFMLISVVNTCGYFVGRFLTFLCTCDLTHKIWKHGLHIIAFFSGNLKIFALIFGCTFSSLFLCYLSTILLRINRTSVLAHPICLRLSKLKLLFDAVSGPLRPRIQYFQRFLSLLWISSAKILVISYTMIATVAPLTYWEVSDRNRSCPAVSHNCSVTATPFSSITFFV